jgi:excisionase family DNA binding protein
MTVDEVAESLRTSPSTVRRLIRHGELGALRIGSQWRVDADDLEAFVAAATTERTPA